MSHSKHPFIVFVLLYFSLTISLGVFLVDWRSPYSYVVFFGFQFLFIGLAYDLTELIVALVCEPHFPPVKTKLTNHPRVALLITVCDDIFPSILDSLDKQSYPNYDIFVLDDSQDLNQRAILDKYPFKIIRRESRQGYKAGNLNNWLNQFGWRYKYFAILDSDSLVKPDFLLNMVLYAEHPENNNIAVFQSKIHTWNMNSLLPFLLGRMSPLRMYVLERVSNRIGNLHSFGHNNLLRTSAVIAVGGFNEALTPEDTVLSIQLDSQKYITALVNVVTYDTEPEDIFRFVRRTKRWAMQTVEVFRFPWREASIGMKLSLHYNLYVYLRPSLYLLFLALTAWLLLSEQTSILPIKSVMFLIFTQRLNILPLLVVFLVMVSLWILPIVLYMILARKISIPIREVISHSVFSIIITNMTFGHVLIGMLRATLGSPTEFVSTNSLNNSQPHELIRYMWPTVLLSVFIVSSIILRNQSILLGLNCLWVFLLVVSPLLFWLLGRTKKVL